MRIARLLVAATIMAIAGCGDTTGPSADPFSVSVIDDRFSPNALTVNTGTTVTFSWMASGQHNVTWLAAGGPPPSATQSSGSYHRTFDTPGTYAYYCTIHGTPTSGMRGSIVVQ